MDQAHNLPVRMLNLSRHGDTIDAKHVYKWLMQCHDLSQAMALE